MVMLLYVLEGDGTAQGWGRGVGERVHRRRCKAEVRTHACVCDELQHAPLRVNAFLIGAASDKLFAQLQVQVDMGSVFQLPVHHLHILHLLILFVGLWWTRANAGNECKTSANREKCRVG